MCAVSLVPRTEQLVGRGVDRREPLVEQVVLGPRRRPPVRLLRGQNVPVINPYG